MSKTVVISYVVPVNFRFFGRDRDHRRGNLESTGGFDGDPVGGRGSGGGDGRRFPLGALGGGEGHGVVVEEDGEAVDVVVPFGRFFGGDEEFVVVD